MTKRFLMSPQALALGLIVFLGFSRITAADEPPDARTLIQGVESVRLQIPPSRLILQTVFQDALATNVNALSVEFDGERRFFGERLESNAKIRALFDGKQAMHFDGSKSVTIRDPRDTTSDYLFDPRLIGITVFYTWSEAIADALPYRAFSNFKTIGREKIGDNQAWHVRMNDTNHSQQVDLWIDESRGFRVYRYDFAIGGASPHSTLSFYENQDYPWLPSRVQSRNYSADGQLIFQREISVLKAEANAKLSESNWSLAALGAPARSTVEDRRIRRIIGTWDGRQLHAQQAAVPVPGPAPKRVALIRAIFLAGVLIPVVALGFIALNKRRQK